MWSRRCRLPGAPKEPWLRAKYPWAEAHGERRLNHHATDRIAEIGGTEMAESAHLEQIGGSRCETADRQRTSHGGYRDGGPRSGCTRDRLRRITQLIIPGFPDGLDADHQLTAATALVDLGDRRLRQWLRSRPSGGLGCGTARQQCGHIILRIDLNIVREQRRHLHRGLTA